MTQYPTFADYLKAEYKGPYVATDIIIQYKGGIVLIDRKFPPHGYALPGGMAERLELPSNAIKEAKEETGLEIKLHEPVTRPYYVSSRVNRDPRAFIASVTYCATGNGTLAPHPDEDAKQAFVVTLDELEKLLEQDTWAFHSHVEVLRAYLLDVGGGKP